MFSMGEPSRNDIKKLATLPRTLLKMNVIELNYENLNGTAPQAGRFLCPFRIAESSFGPARSTAGGSQALRAQFKTAVPSLPPPAWEKKSTRDHEDTPDLHVDRLAVAALSPQRFQFQRKTKTLLWTTEKTLLSSRWPRHWRGRY
jgi:hypothetical protein